MIEAIGPNDRKTFYRIIRPGHLFPVALRSRSSPHNFLPTIIRFVNSSCRSCVIATDANDRDETPCRENCLECSEGRLDRTTSRATPFSRTARNDLHEEREREKFPPYPEDDNDNATSWKLAVRRNFLRLGDVGSGNSSLLNSAAKPSHPTLLPLLAA